LLTRKRSQVQTLSRPPPFLLVKDLSAPSGQRSSRAAAALRPQAVPHRTEWALQNWTTRDHHSPNDHAAWSPPHVPGPWSGTTPTTAQDTLRGPVSNCSIHAPRHPLAPWPWTIARGRPGSEAARSLGASQVAALGCRRPSCEPARANAAPAPPIGPMRAGDHAVRGPRRHVESAAPTGAARRTHALHELTGAGNADTGRTDAGHRTPETDTVGWTPALDMHRTPDARTLDTVHWTRTPDTGRADAGHVHRAPDAGHAQRILDGRTRTRGRG
jgi:hypothetical protein